MECVCSGSDIAATMMSLYCYDITVAAAVAIKRIMLYPAAEIAIVAEGLVPEVLVNINKKGKVFPYSLPSVGPGADPGVQAVSPQVT